MFERFTDRARRVVVLAQDEARRLAHNYVGTEHILLGIVAEGEGVGAQALNELGLQLEVIRTQVEDIIGHGGSPPSGHLPYTPRAKKVLELSLREALQLGHNYIGTEHILLGLVREGEGVAAKVLIEKTTLSAVRNEVIRILNSYQPQSPEPVLTQAEARKALLGEPDLSSVLKAVLVCTDALDGLESKRHRTKALALLAAWYASERP